jgi:hypothetical protein
VAFSKARRLNPAEKLFFRGAARDDQVAGLVALFGERWLTPQRVWTPRALARVLGANLRAPKLPPAGQ